MSVFIEAIFATYALLCLTHLGLQLVLAHAHYLRWREKKRRATPRRGMPPVSVIYPVYNEAPDVLERVLDCARGCLRLGGLELILVDDGSPNRAELQPIYDRFRGERVHVLFQENRGKRAAQYAGLAVATGEIIITVDSDTLIDERGIRRLIAPFDDPKIGAVCGDVVVENRDVNLLTRLIGLRYWTAFNLERAAQSFVKQVLCCSGPFSAYRGDLLRRIKEKYVAQTFCGRRCTYGDDRHLTNLVLAESYQVVYEPRAVGRTFVPESLGEYVRQQNRWNKSFYREILWTLPLADRIHPYVMLDMLLQPVLLVGFTLSLAYSLLAFRQSGDWLLPVYYVATLVFMSALRAAYGLFRTLDPRFLLFLLYGFLHVLALVPIRFKSLLTLTDNAWGTRASRGTNAYRDLAAWACGYGCLLWATGGLLGVLNPNRSYDAPDASRTFAALIGDWPFQLAYPLCYAITLAFLLAVVPRACGRLGRRDQPAAKATRGQALSARDVAAEPRTEQSLR